MFAEFAFVSFIICNVHKGLFCSRHSSHFSPDGILDIVTVEGNEEAKDCEEHDGISRQNEATGASRDLKKIVMLLIYKEMVWSAKTTISSSKSTIISCILVPAYHGGGHVIIHDNVVHLVRGHCGGGRGGDVGVGADSHGGSSEHNGQSEGR